MSLVGGSALIVEDLDVTFKVVTFDTAMSIAAKKYKGKVSKRRYNNIMKMARRREYKRMSQFLKEWRGKN